MDLFWIYLKIGLHHVLDRTAYDHILFIMAMVLPFTFKDWKKVLTLVSLFTIGHTLSLLLSVFEVIKINALYVELLIPITILLTAIYRIFTSKKNTKTESLSFVAITTLFFGIIHGLGFSNYFKMIMPGNASDKIVPLLAFALGIELAQILVVFVFLALSFLVQTVFKLSKRDWVLVTASFIIGVIFPMLLHHEIWNK